ncbi:MAG TPA: ferritin-like domain-containing protein [Solirubrobacteraceae bacterium]|jgi:bacterioferritin (cytochrome b1)
MSEDSDAMDVKEVLHRLNEALALQNRSVLQYTHASASTFGLEFQGLTAEFWTFGRRELEDTKLLVEKIAALGGDPTTEVRDLTWSADPAEAIKTLIEAEDRTIACLHAVIPASGQEPRSEALEHLIEHIIMRKQNQVDWMRRATRTA